MQFISTTPTNTTAATPRESAYTSNESATTGRLLLFVVDEGSLRVGANRTILRSAQSLFERLAPGDLVGLARLPNGAGGVEFTADRKRITDALDESHRRAEHAHRAWCTVNISEAWALESNDASTFQNAVSRECSGMSGPDLEACRNQLEADARAMLLEASSRARATLQSLEALLKNLIQLKTPVNIVMISEGMFVARDRQSMTALGRLAAEARATIHIIRPSQQFFDIEDRARRRQLVAVLRRRVDERGARAGGRPDARLDERRQRRRQDRVRSARPRAVRLLPARLRAERGRSHRPRAAHQGRR